MWVLVLTLARNAQKEFLIGRSSRSHSTYCPTISGWLLVLSALWIEIICIQAQAKICHRTLILLLHYLAKTGSARHWCTHLCACVKAKGTHFEHKLGQMLLLLITALSTNHFWQMLSVLIYLFLGYTVKTKGFSNYIHCCGGAHRLSKIGRTWGVWRELESSLDPKMTKHNF